MKKFSKWLSALIDRKVHKLRCKIDPVYRAERRRATQELIARLQVSKEMVQDKIQSKKDLKAAIGKPQSFKVKIIEID